MDIVKTSLNVERYVGTFHAEAHIESGIPLPQNRSPKRVLSADASVTAASSVCIAGGIDVSGSLTLHIIAEDADSSLFCFDATAEYTHRIAEQAVTPSMNAHVSAQIFSCRCRAEEGGLRLSADITLTAVTLDQCSVAAISTLAGDATLQQKQLELVQSRRLFLGAQSIKLREEAKITPNCTLLSQTASCEIIGIVPSADGAAIEGKLFIKLLLLDADGGIVGENLSFPFSCLIPYDGAESLFASAQINQLNAVTVDIQQGIVEVNAVLSVSLYGRQKTATPLLYDAYDTDGSFSCSVLNMESMQYRQTEKKGVALSERLSVPSHLPEVYMPLYSSAQAAVTAIRCEDDKLRVDGMIQLTAVYRCDAGLVHSFIEELPMSFTVDVNCELPLPTLDIADVNLLGSGRVMDAAISLCLTVDCYSKQQIRCIEELNYCEPPEQRRGILIYYADEGETLFEVGKRFLTPISVLKQFNPDLKEPLTDGQQVFLMK
ncbi:MAG: hypothetical protein Q4C01_00935 [Clostridia bacterium]|nr:hypothetical protein [Clostridia bacterium]